MTDRGLRLDDMKCELLAESNYALQSLSEEVFRDRLLELVSKH